MKPQSITTSPVTFAELIAKITVTEKTQREINHIDSMILEATSFVSHPIVIAKKGNGHDS